ncbi:hypothetical protein OKW24_001421 [Peribacillus simplex]|nr:hypothetical protein [Peribacillus simplex]
MTYFEGSTASTTIIRAIQFACTHFVRKGIYKKRPHSRLEEASIHRMAYQLVKTKMRCLLRASVQEKAKPSILHFLF